MSIPYYVPPSERSAVSAAWNKAKAQKRMERGADADTLRSRALHDARGTVIREGITYRSTGETKWVIRRSVTGRTDQYEFVANGKIKLVAGPRRFPLCFRPASN